LDVASAPCKDILTQAMCLGGKFELIPGPPEHKSATSVVHFAYEHTWVDPTTLQQFDENLGDDIASEREGNDVVKAAVSGEDSPPSPQKSEHGALQRPASRYADLLTPDPQPGSKTQTQAQAASSRQVADETADALPQQQRTKVTRKVALKFMKYREQFENEINSRRNSNFNPEFVLLIDETFDGDVYDRYQQSCLEKVTAVEISGRTNDKKEATEIKQERKMEDLSANKDYAFRKSAVKRGFTEYPYVLVMEYMDQSLQKVIYQQHIAGGHDWDSVRMISKSLCVCLLHIHTHAHILHGDIKPMNIVVNSQASGSSLLSVKLIDFDACASFTGDRIRVYDQGLLLQAQDSAASPAKTAFSEDLSIDPSSTDVNQVKLSETVQEYAGCKFSSAYLPPEMFWASADKPNHVLVKSCKSKHIASNGPVEMSPSIVDGAEDHKDETQEAPEPMLADPSMDMWAFGCILYLLCSGVTLFRASVEDNLTPADMPACMHWNEALKAEKLSIITDRYARNLLSLLLEKDPSKRPTAETVLTHPFFTGVHPERMIGEDAKFDVFISYRVSSDADHAQLLYNMLRNLELRVWLDKECLLPGQPWEDGFCDGLINSSCFVCLLSRNAINNPTKTWQNFEHLEASSRCDNVLLEWRLALELRERQLIDAVFPVLIGDCEEENGKVTYSNYFPSKCHPANLPTVAVASVESKMHEHLTRQGLGFALTPNMTVRDIVDTVVSNQGGFLRNDPDAALKTICDTIVSMKQAVTAKKNKQRELIMLAKERQTSRYRSLSKSGSNRSKSGKSSQTSLRSIPESEPEDDHDEHEEIAKLKDEIKYLEEIAKLKKEMKFLSSKSDSSGINT
jgi:serine/threonine protein kinase